MGIGFSEGFFVREAHIGDLFGYPLFWGAKRPEIGVSRGVLEGGFSGRGAPTTYMGLVL